MSKYIDNRLGFHGASKVPLHSVQAQAAAMNVDGHVVTDAKVWTAALSQFPLNSTTAMKTTTDIVGATNDLISVFTNNRTVSDKITKTALHNGYVWRNSDYPAVELYDAVEMSAIPGSNGAESPNGEFQSYEILDGKNLRVVDWVPVTAVIDPETGSPTPGYSGIAEAYAGGEWTVLQDSSKGSYGWALAKGNWEFVTMAGMLRFEPTCTPEGYGYSKVRYTGFKYIGTVLTDTLEEVKESVATDIQPKLTELEGKITAEESARAGADTELGGRIDTLAGTVADNKTATDAAIALKVDSVDGKSLVADELVTRLSVYPEYQDVIDLIDGQADIDEVNAAIAEALKAYYTAALVDEKIAAAVVKVHKYIGTVETISDLPAAGTEGLAIGHIYHVNADSGEYAWNGEIWEPLGSIVDLSNYYTKGEVDTAVAGEKTRAEAEEARIAGLVTAEETRAKAAEEANTGKITKEISDREAAITDVTTAIEGVAGRVTTAESDIDALQAATVDFDGTNTVKAAIAAAQGAAEATAAAYTDTKAGEAESAAKGYTDDEINKAKTDIKSAYEQADTGLSGRIDDLTGVVATNKSDIEGALADAVSDLETADGELDKAIKANASAIEVLGNSMSADITAEETARTNADNALSGRLDVVEAAAAGFSGEATIAAGIAAAKAEAISEAGTAADGKVSTAKTEITGAYEAADAVLDGKISANATAISDEADAREAADSALQAAVDAKADPVKLVVVGNGTPAEPEAVAMVYGSWYVIKAPCTCTLPAGAAEGTFIKVSVAIGGDARRVVAPEGETINGSSNPCALGITDDGIAIAAESYYFVKIGTDWVIL